MNIYLLPVWVSSPSLYTLLSRTHTAPSGSSHKSFSNAYSPNALFLQLSSPLIHKGTVSVSSHSGTRTSLRNTPLTGTLVPFLSYQKNVMENQNVTLFLILLFHWVKSLPFSQMTPSYLS